MESTQLVKLIDRFVEYTLYLVVALVPLVYYNNPIATEYFFSKSLVFNFFVYLGIALFFARALAAKQLELRWGVTFLPLSLFCLVIVSSIIGATNPFKSFETILRVGACIPLLFLIYQVVGTKQVVFRLLAVVAIVNLGVATFGFLQYFEVFPLPRDQYGAPNPSTTIGLTNFVMEYMTPFMFILPFMVFIEKRWFWRALYLTSTLFTYYYFIIANNRAAYVGWVFTLPLGALLLYSQYRRGLFRFTKLQLTALATGLILGVIGLAVSPDGQRLYQRAQSVVNAATNPDSETRFRLQTWKQSLVLIADNPIRGVGLSNLEVEFPLYQSPFLERMTLNNNTRVVRAHNEYIQAFADLGLLGGIAFTWFLVTLVRLGYRSYRRAIEWNDLLLVTGLILGIHAFLIVAFFAFPFHIPASAMSIFTVIGLLEVMHRRILQPEPVSTRWTVPTPNLKSLALAGALVGTLFWAYSTSSMWRVLQAEVYFKESRVMKNLNQWETAKQLLDDAIRLYPTNEAYYYDRSIFSIRDRRPQEALRFLSTTAELVPNYGVGRKQLGLMYAQMREYDTAIAELRHAYRIFPSYGHEYVPLLVTAKLGAGKIDEAVALVEREAEAGIDGRDFRLSAGQAFIQGRQYERAAYYLQRILDDEPSAVDARAFLALAHVEAGNFAGAMTEVLKAMPHGPQGQTRNVLESAHIRALAGLGRTNEAVELVSATLATDPTARERLLREPQLVRIPELQPLLRP